ncbi:MAG: alpha/beta hydrolase [Anaerolineae bacterium]|nr:alpha/beta hydrolase [Anaerolineae bacterium]
MKKLSGATTGFLVLASLSLFLLSFAGFQAGGAVDQTLQDTMRTLGLKAVTEQDYRKIEQLMNTTSLSSGQVVEMTGAYYVPGEINPGMYALGFKAQKGKVLDAGLGTYQSCRSKAAVSIFDLDKASGSELADFLRIAEQGFAPELASIGLTPENLQKMREAGFKVVAETVEYQGSSIQVMSIPKFTQQGSESGRKEFAIWKDGNWLFQIALETFFDGREVVDNPNSPDTLQYPSCPLPFNPGPSLESWYRTLHDAAVRNGLIGGGQVQAPQAAGEMIPPRVVIRDEPRNESKAQYLGVAADGVSTLPVHLINDDPQRTIQASIERPVLGKLLDSKGQDMAGKRVQIPPNETRLLYYAPPDALESSLLTEAVPLGAEGDRAAYGAAVVLNFEFTSEDWPASMPDSALLLVFRPPVHMVHGYFGSEDTWQYLISRLDREKFDAQAGRYLPGFENSSIEAMAEDLESDIAGLLNEYRNKDIKITKADVVAHSMGGLITRQYMTRNENYKNIRKLIMLATPNHGVNDWVGVPRALASGWYKTHFAASFQLNAVNAFFDHINQGEDSFEHLQPGVEYANIIGRAGCGPLCPDDAVVPVASCHLNGVAEYIFENTIHSGSLLAVSDYLSDANNPYFRSSDAGITDSPAVGEKVIQLLTTRIERAPPDAKWSLALMNVEGDVSVGKLSSGKYEKVARYPLDLPVNYQVKTGQDGKAVVILYLRGQEARRIALQPNSEIGFGVSYADEFSVWLQSGEGRFERSFNEEGEVKEGSGFNLAVGKKPVTSEEGAFIPAMWVRDLQTAFVVSADDPPHVIALEGSLLLSTFSSDGQPARVAEVLQANSEIVMVMDASGNLVQQPAPAQHWWEEAIYTQEYAAPAWAKETSPARALPFAAIRPVWYLLGGGFCLGLAAILVFAGVVVLRKRRPVLATPAAPPASYAPAPRYDTTPSARAPQKERGKISGCALAVVISGLALGCLGLAGGLFWMNAPGLIPDFSGWEEAIRPAEEFSQPVAPTAPFEPIDLPTHEAAAPPSQELQPLEEPPVPAGQPSSGDGTQNLPSAGNFAACLGPCLPDLSNSQTTFPGGTKEIFFRFDYQDIPPGAEVTRRWSSDGWVWARYECAWDGPASGVFETSLREPGGLKSGPWELEIVVNNRAILQETIILDGSHTYWAPAGVITGRCK